MQDRSIIDANKQIMQERNREEKGTEERWCDMARNCSPTPQVNLFPLLLRALSSNISSTLQTPFLLQSDPKSLHQLWWLYWKGSSAKSISHNFCFKSILYALRPFWGEGCKGQGLLFLSSQTFPKAQPHPRPSISLTTLYSLHCILLHIPKC